MSTRGLYTFIGENSADTWNVYKHSDNYPSGAVNTLQTALDYFAWQLPRYEADEFAAAFIAAGKCQAWLWSSKFNRKNFNEYKPKGPYHSFNGGNVRMMPQGNPCDVASRHCSDIEYRYEIYMGNEAGVLRIRAYSVNAWKEYSEELLVDASFKDFVAWTKKKEKESV